MLKFKDRDQVIVFRDRKSDDFYPTVFRELIYGEIVSIVANDNHRWEFVIKCIETESYSLRTGNYHMKNFKENEPHNIVVKLNNDTQIGVYSVSDWVFLKELFSKMHIAKAEEYDNLAITNQILSRSRVRNEQ